METGDQITQRLACKKNIQWRCRCERYVVQVAFTLGRTDAQTVTAGNLETQLGGRNHPYCHSDSGLRGRWGTNATREAEFAGQCCYVMSCRGIVSGGRCTRGYRAGENLTLLR